MLFMEGILTFISPCLIPMLPLFLSYFAGQDQEGDSRKTVLALLEFILGFSLVFSLLNVLVYSVGTFFLVHQNKINFLAGLWMVLLGIDNLNHNRWSQKVFKQQKGLAKPASHLLFGMVFAISWTPCVGAYLSSALALSLSADNVFQSLIMIWTYSLGLGLPLFISGLLLEEVKGFMAKMKNHSHLIFKLASWGMIIFGLLWMTGYLSTWITI